MSIVQGWGRGRDVREAKEAEIEAQMKEIQVGRTGTLMSARASRAVISCQDFVSFVQSLGS